MSTPVFELNYAPSGMYIQCPVQTQIEYDVQEIVLRNGYSKRYARDTTPTYVFETELKYLTTVQRDYIKTFFEARKASYESFYIYWNGEACDPTAAKSTNRYLVIFDMKNLQFDVPYHNLFNVKLKFRTVQA